MGIIKVNSPRGVLNFKISGDKPNSMESIKIKNILLDMSRTPTQTSSQLIDSQKDIQDPNQIIKDEPQFDTKTGIRDAKLRAALSASENQAEQELTLGKFGLGAEDYIRDQRGRLALTPSGASKFGVESDKNVLIDEQGFSKSDLFDLAGLTPEVGTAVLGAVKGARLGSIFGPLGLFIGGATGAALGAFGGSLGEEAIEATAGVSKQTTKQILDDAKREAIYAGVGELTFGAPFLIFKAVRPSSQLVKEGGEKLDIVGEGTERGYAFPAKTYGVGPLAQKSEELLGAVIGTTPALSKSRKQLDIDVKKYKDLKKKFEKQGAGNFGTLLSQLPKNRTQEIVNQSNQIQNKLVQDLKKVTKITNKSAINNETINDDLFKQLTISLKNFDDEATAQFAVVDDFLKDKFAKQNFIDTTPLRELNEDVIKVRDRNQDLEKLRVQDYLIKSFETITVGQKTNFKTLYDTSRKLNKIIFSGSKPDGMPDVVFQKIINDPELFKIVKLYKNTVDELLTLSPQSLANVNNLTGDQITSFNNALKSLKAGNRFYQDGIKLYNNISTNLANKQLINVFKEARDQIKAGQEINIPTDKIPFAINLVKPKNKKPLTDLKEAFQRLEGKDGNAVYNKFKERIATTYLDDIIRSSGLGSNNPTNFNTSSLYKSLSELGETGDELFGPKTFKEILKQSKELDLLGPTKITQSNIDNFLANKKSITSDDIKQIKETIQQDKLFKTNNLLRQIRLKSVDEDISIQDAMDVISNNRVSQNELKEIIGYFKTTPEKLNSVKAAYIETMLDGIGANFDAKVLKRFSDNIKKLDGVDNFGRSKNKLDIIFSKSEAADFRQFGNILRILGEDIGNASLVAAGITANPLAQIPKIARITIIGNLFTSKRARQQVVDAHRRSRGLTPEKRSQVVGDALLSAIRQITIQNIDEGAQKAEQQVQSVIESQGLGEQLENIRGDLNLPSPSSALGDLNITAPNITTPLTPTATVGPQSNLRQRIKDDPAAANVLLGGLGSLGLA